MLDITQVENFKESIPWTGPKLLGMTLKKLAYVKHSSLFCFGICDKDKNVLDNINSFTVLWAELVKNMLTAVAV
jgi:hypothetical protein